MLCRAEIRSFSEKDSHQYTQELMHKIQSDLKQTGKEYILNVEENEYIQYMISKYTLEELHIIQDSEEISKPIITNERMTDRVFNKRYMAEMYNFTINYHYTGTKELFYIRPSTYTMTHYNICLDKPNMVSFTIRITQRDSEMFNREKNQAYSSAFSNVKNINSFVNSWNAGIEGRVKQEFTKLKKKYIEEDSFFAAINVKTNKDTRNVFTVPTIKAVETPKPKMTKKKTYTPEPTMSDDMYDDVLKIIYSIGQSMERKPSLYVGKDEEALRDQFLLFLETRYEGVSATGETFNKHGKTDILLKHQEDGSNLFIAELKVWHGQSQFLEAISQLFDRYLTWRDSKVAVMMFVPNKEFTKTIEAVKSSIKEHPYYLEELAAREDTSLSYKFHLAEDKDKEVYLEVMMFHFPENRKDIL